LVKEEEKLKYAAQNPIDITKAFYSKPVASRPVLPSSTSHFCSGAKCLHPSHFSAQKPAPSHRPPSANPDGTQLTFEQRQARQRYFDDLKKTTACHHCNNPGHWKGECPLLSEEERQAYKKQPPRQLLRSSSTPALQASSLAEPDSYTFAFMATLSELPSPSDVWYVDSAASRHMTGQRSWFTTFTDLPDLHWPVKGISAQPLHATGIGDIVISYLVNNLWKTAYLEQVLYVPGLDNNLFSVTRAAAKDIQTTCTSIGCTMSLRGVPILQALLHGMMYELQVQVIPPGHTSHALVSASFRPGTNIEERQPLDIWHNRLCHISYDAVKKLAHSNLIEGIQLLTNPSAPDPFCEGCCKGKQHRTLFPTKSIRTRASTLGDLLYVDLMGPIDPISVGGASYCLLIKDVATGYRLVFCNSKKSDTLACLQQAVRQVLRDTNQTIKTIRIDRGGEFVSKAAAQFYDLSLIRHELTTPYNPEQNGAVERENRTVMELVRSMIHSQNVPPKFWAETTHTAVYVLNRTLSRTLLRTPFESWHHQHPSLSHLRTFGCPTYIYAEKHTRSKLDSKNRPGIFMGYTTESKAYRIWDTTKDKIVISRDVIFHETSTSISFPTTPVPVQNSPVTIHFPRTLALPPASLSVPPKNRPVLPSSPVSLIPSVSPAPLPTPLELSSPQASHSTSSDSLNPELRSRLLSDFLAAPYYPAESDPQDHIDLQLHPPLRPTRTSKLPDRYGDWAYFSTLIDDTIVEPHTMIKALSSSHKDKWIAAMQVEFSSLLENATWELVSLPPTRKAISCK
jgi:hypothetical protein